MSSLQETNRLDKLRPEVKEKLRSEIAAVRRAEHGARVRAGVKKAGIRGLIRGRGRSPGALTESEIKRLVSLYVDKKWGMKKISNELTRERRAKGEPKAADGTLIEVAPSKVKRKLTELGYIKPLGASYL